MAGERSKRRMPEINSSSAADVSFLLLLFFILTSSIGLRKVLPVRISPPVAENVRQEPIRIKERNFLPVYIDENDRIFFRTERIESNALRILVKEFVANPDNRDDLAEKITEEVPLIGKVEVSNQHVISLSGHDKSHFQTYVFVQNELLAAYDELRDQLALKVFDKPYRALGQEEQGAINTCYPRRISKPEKIKEGGEQ